MNRQHMQAGAAALALALAQASAFAVPRAPDPDAPLGPLPATAPAALGQRPGAALPLAAAFTDSEGRVIRLATLFAPASPRPVILVLGYYRCPQMCGLLMQGLLEAARATGLPPASYRIVFVSIDPADTAADASVRRRVDLDYARFLDGADAATPAPSLDLLVGAPSSVAQLARAIGYAYTPTPPADRTGAASAARFVHPTGIVVATPDGHVSRTLMGVRFDPVDLRAALVEAADGRIGGLTDRLALICAHAGPAQGGRTATVIGGLRIVGATTIALLGLFAWRNRSRTRPGTADASARGEAG